LFASRAQEREHLLVDGLHPEHERLGRAGPSATVEYIEAFDILEHPTHGRAIGRFVDLAGDRLAGRGTLAQDVGSNTRRRALASACRRRVEEDRGLKLDSCGDVASRQSSACTNAWMSAMA
jgi:hypothetical protein